jgi:hypothetical protein
MGGYRATIRRALWHPSQRGAYEEEFRPVREMPETECLTDDPVGEDDRE